MAIRTDAELKAFYERFDEPTEEQFADLIDSKAHVNMLPKVRDLGSGVLLCCTEGYTATLVDGVLTIVVPLGGYHKQGHIDVTPADCEYEVETSGAYKVVIDNTANGHTLGFDPSFYSRTTTDAVSPTNKLKFNFEITRAKYTDQENFVGITSIVFPEAATRATAGGVIKF